MDACLRCGNFTKGPEAAVAGIPLCKTCLDDELAGKDPILLVAPRPVIGARLRLVAPWFFIGGIFWAGVVVGLIALAEGPPDAFVPGGVVAFFIGAVLTLCAYVLIRISWVHHAGNLIWKSIVARKLGFPNPEDPAFPFRLAFHFRRRPSFFDLRLPIDLGLFAEAEGGLMFLGGRGTRLAIPIGSVAKVELERVIMMPPRTSVRVDMKDGAQHFIAFFEGETFAANLLLAIAARDRIAARIVKP